MYMEIKNGIFIPFSCNMDDAEYKKYEDHLYKAIKIYFDYSKIKNECIYFLSDHYLELTLEFIKNGLKGIIYVKHS